VKKFVFITLSLCSWCFSLLAQTTEGGLVRVAGHEVDERLHYFTTLNQLVSAQSWDPVSQPLPINLATELNHAQNHIMKNERLTERLRIGPSISIGRLFWDSRNTNILEAPGLANKWAMQFDFYSASDHHQSFKPMVLLGGTYALVIDLAQLRTPEMTNEFRKSISRFSPVRLENLSGNTTPISKTDRPDFRCPKVHWDADSGAAYPMDLQAEAMRGRDICAQRLKLSKDSLTLVQINLEHYIPVQAAQFQHLTTEELLNNWATLFEYSTDEKADMPHYWVGELLDGTILDE
jgi:hypothetical protein